MACKQHVNNQQLHGHAHVRIYLEGRLAVSLLSCSEVALPLLQQEGDEPLHKLLQLVRVLHVECDVGQHVDGGGGQRAVSLAVGADCFL